MLKKTNGKTLAKKRLAEVKPQIISLDSDYSNRKLAESVLPEGASLLPKVRKKAEMYSSYSGQSTMGGSGGGSQFHTQRPYLPEFDSPDRQYYPQNRVEANRYWRLFYKFDPFFGTAIDMYTQMMVSDFDIVLENENDQSIKNQLTDMCDKVNIQNVLQTLIREYLVLGEVFPHCSFSEQSGIWSYVGFHNPDWIDVMDSPIIDMEPIMYFIPDDNLRDLISDNSPEAVELRQKLPPEFVSKVLAKQKIRLSNLNCSYLARKLHPYDERGVGMGSRLWRIWMVEDSVYSATLAMNRRAASALKVLKLGDASTGYIPAPSVQQDYLRMLAQAEQDPQAWCVTSYAVNFESWGNQDRTVSLSREYDTIEKAKLVAMGLSKSFMTGESSISSAKSGIQVFLRRLLSMRQYFESTWLLPKFFAPIVQINDWTKSTPSEVNHKYRIKRTAQEKADSNLFVKVKLNWKNKLDPKVDEEVLRAYTQLKNFGFNVSHDSVGSSVSLDWKDELKKAALEFKERDEILSNTLGPSLKEKFEKENAPQQPGQGAKPPGTPGAGAMPPGSMPKPKPPAGGQPGVVNAPGTAEPVNGPLSESFDGPSDSGMTI